MYILLCSLPFPSHYNLTVKTQKQNKNFSFFLTYSNESLRFWGSKINLHLFLILCPQNKIFQTCFGGSVIGKVAAQQQLLLEQSIMNSEIIMPPNCTFQQQFPLSVTHMTRHCLGFLVQTRYNWYYPHLSGLFQFKLDFTVM